MPYCMKNGYHIHVSEETGLSADLLYQLTKILIPVLNDAKPYGFQGISIDALPVYKSLKKGKGVATGISRGIDSFYTILNNLDGLFPLTDLTLFNVQSFGEFGGEAARRYFHKEIEKAKEICRDLNREYGTELNLVTVDSNIQDILPIEIFSSGSYRDAGAILLLKQKFQLYYFSTTEKLVDFDLGSGIRKEDSWIFYCLSTENYRIQLFGAEATRIDKAEYISRHPVTYDNLMVCHQPLLHGNEDVESMSHINCTCGCEKCRYTVMGLVTVNKLEKYGKVFDLNQVREKYKDILAESVVKKNLEAQWADVYRAFCQKGEIDALFEQKVLEEQGDFDIAPESHTQRILEQMDNFLIRIQKNPSIAERLVREGYRTVAIYGMGRLGKLLYCELKDMVRYAIDKNAEQNYGEVPLKGMDDEFPPVDLVVITTVYGKKAIMDFLSKRVMCKVMVLEELLNL